MRNLKAVSSREAMDAAFKREIAIGAKGARINLWSLAMNGHGLKFSGTIAEARQLAAALDLSCLDAEKLEVAVASLSAPIAKEKRRTK